MAIPLRTLHLRRLVSFSGLPATFGYMAFLLRALRLRGHSSTATWANFIEQSVHFTWMVLPPTVGYMAMAILPRTLHPCVHSSEYWRSRVIEKIEHLTCVVIPPVI